MFKVNVIKKNLKFLKRELFEINQEITFSLADNVNFLKQHKYLNKDDLSILKKLMDMQYEIILLINDFCQIKHQLILFVNNIIENIFYRSNALDKYYTNFNLNCKNIIKNIEYEIFNDLKVLNNIADVFYMQYDIYEKLKNTKQLD